MATGASTRGSLPAIRNRGAERFALLMDIFEEAALASPEMRGAILSNRCGSDAELLAEVRAMLAHADTPEHLATGAGIKPALAAQLPQQHDHQSPPHLPVLTGNYRILRMLGEGGMGVVYLAEQALPRRLVALKAMRPGVASRQLLRRFEREAQILGRLQHTGIAQIYEAGADSADRADQAFIAMEYVAGQTITDYAQSAGLSTRGRMELLARVCDAVQHAHQRLVIHRDLKPSNILVDGSGEPKVLDFGVARLVEREEDASLVTNAAALVGTLAYMSPEQVGGESSGADSIDTRTDIFALGVILHQLLAGKLPLDLSGKPLPDAARIIRDIAPMPLGQIDPAFRGDIETIAARAMDKDRTRRYQSAADLGADLRRCLAGEPILARQDSAVYVLRKQLQRYRTVATAAALGLIGLVAFATYARIQAGREADARHAAEVAHLKADEQRLRADASATALTAALDASSIEQGRLLAHAGSMTAAEQLIWPRHLSRHSLHSLWALRELYDRFPCQYAAPITGGAPRNLACNHRGELAAITTDAGTVSIVEIATGREVKAIQGDQAQAAAFSADGAFLFVAGDDMLTRYSSDDWRELDRWPVAGGKAAGLAIGRGPTEGLVILASEDGRIRLLDASSGQTRREIAAHTGPVSCLDLDESGGLLITGGEDSWVVTWRVPEGREVSRVAAHSHAVTALRLAPGGASLATAGADNLLRVWSIRDGEVLHTPDAETRSLNAPVAAIAFAHDGRTFMTASALGIDQWRTDDAARASRPRLEHPARGLALLDGDRVLVVNDGGWIRLWKSPETGQPRQLAFDAGPLGLFAACSPDGHSIAVASPAHSGMRLLNADDGSEIWHLGASGSSAIGFRFSMDGESLVGWLMDGSVCVWSLRSGEETARVTGVIGTASVRITPDDQWLITTHIDGCVRWWSTADGSLGRVIDTGQGEVRNTTLTRDGSLLATIHRRGTVMLFDLEAGDAPHSLDIADASSFQFLVEGHTLLVGYRDGRIEVWDARSRRRLRTLKGRHDSLLVVAGSGVLPDGGSLFASLAADGTVQLWDQAGPFCLGEFRYGLSPSINVSLDRAGRRMVTSQADGSIAVWDLGRADAAIAGNNAWAKTVMAPRR